MPALEAPLSTGAMGDFYHSLNAHEHKFSYDDDPYSYLPPNGDVPPADSPSTAYLPFIDRSFNSNFQHVPWPNNAPFAEPLHQHSSPSKPSGAPCQSSAKRAKAGLKCCTEGCPKVPVPSLEQMVDPKNSVPANISQCEIHVKSEMEAFLEAGSSAHDSSINRTPRSPELSPVLRSRYHEQPTNRNSLKRNSSSAYETTASKKSSGDNSLSQTSSDTVSKSSSSNLSKTSSNVSNTIDEQGVPPARLAKASHCQVERKYRENLNTKFETLRRAIPSMQSPGDNSLAEGPDLEDLGGSSKPRKADVLSNATDYLKQMEEKNRAMGNEIDFLRSRVQAIEKLIKCEDCWLLNGVSGMRFDPQGGGSRFPTQGGSEPFDPQAGGERFDPQGGGTDAEWMEQSPT
ncbi:hypothetical protein MMC11_001229 [Xylographa trunciseda]|nr:hypothetical protein [Xylographa trunciseda]